MNLEPHAMRDTTVGELMTRRVMTLRDTDTIAHAHQILLWSGFRHLPVLSAGRLVGIVSDRDLLRFAADPAALTASTSVTEVMTELVETVTPDTTITEASARMAAGRIDALPVVDTQGALVGIITSTDVLAERGSLVHKGGELAVPTVAAVMRTAIATLSPDTSLVEAVSVFARAPFRHLPVVDHERRLVGIVSDRDVRTRIGDPVRVLLDEEAVGVEVGDTVESVMTEHPIALRTDASLLELADTLLDERVGAIPIVDDDERLAGIASYIDVLGYLVGRPGAFVTTGAPFEDAGAPSSRDVPV
jgi:CBS-domain-containing membrane protein